MNPWKFYHENFVLKEKSSNLENFPSKYLGYTVEHFNWQNHCIDSYLLYVAKLAILNN